MPISLAKTPTPLGEMLLAATDAALIGCWFAGQKYFPLIAPERLRQAPLICPPGTAVGGNGNAACLPAKFLKAKKNHTGPSPSPLLLQAAEELWAYFGGKRRDFSLPLEPVGTPFQCTVWRALRTIPYGQTATYSRLAEIAGSPGAFRAVGTAVGRNPLSILIPCHRIVGASGSLTGYAGGLDRKKHLLKLEGARVDQM